MAKRSASSDINHENWDAPYQPEKAGSFKTAPQEVLQKRVLKVARRSLKSSNSTESGKSVFASFGGFKSSAVSSGTPIANKPFGFLGGVTSSNNVTTTNGTTLSTLPAKESVTPQQQYLADLKQLNLSVSNWIKTHIDSNPLCILTPVFSDYEKHLMKIQEERDASEKSGSTALPTPSIGPSFNFVSSSTSENNKFTINVPLTTADTVKKTFTFGDTSDKMNSLDSNKTSPSMFSTGTGKSPLLKAGDEAQPKTMSIFGSFGEKTGVNLMSKPDPASLMVNPFTSVLNKDKTESNPSLSAPTSTNKDEEEETESEEPPKVEFTPLQEEGSVFSTRCKVFVKKDDNYKDRGVGTLFIKKVGDDKHQLLVRAETVLGNILVNILLTASVPTQRMGKNNVMLVCIPTPQDPPPPTTVLLRVKTPADADILLATLDKYKQ